MRMTADQAREKFAIAQVAALATADADAVPHVVPVTFAVSADTVVFAVDDKPKSTIDLRRLRNIAANPEVSLLVQHYEDDWSRLWWARADGTATIHQAAAERASAVRWLCAKYPSYTERPPQGVVVRIEVTRWSGWQAAPSAR